MATLFEAVVMQAVGLNLENRCSPENQDLAGLLGPANYVRECGTVHVNCGRGTGKSSFIRDRLARPGSVVIVANEASRIGEFDAMPTVFSPETIAACPAASLIFVDEPLHVFARIDRERFYGLLIRRPDQVVVLLGE